jgi:hypothetical protein
MKSFTFRSTDLTDAELKSFAKEAPGKKLNFTVTRDVRNAAENKILELAKERAFTTNRSLVDCIEFIMNASTHESLARLSRAEIASERSADVSVL